MKTSLNKIAIFAICTLLILSYRHQKSIADIPLREYDNEFGQEAIVTDDTGVLPLSLVEETDDPNDSQSLDVEEERSSGIVSNKVATSKSIAKELRNLKLRVIPATEKISAGIRILEIEPNSTISKIGLKPNDVVRSINGNALNSRKGFVENLTQSIELSDSVLLIERDGQEVVLPLVFGAGNGSQDSRKSGETTTILNVTDVDISALVKTFSKLTKRNYIVDSSVKGTVTIHLPTPVTISESLRILDTVLLLKGFTTVPVAENTWKVVSAKDARQTTIPLLSEDVSGDSDVMVTKMVRLTHIAAADLQQLLTQFISKDGVINAFEGTNSLIIIDSAQNINRLQRLVSELDVPAIDQEMSIIPILHADAEDISEKINEILGEEEEEQNALSVSQRTAQARAANFSRNRGRNNNNNTNNANANIKARSLGFKIIPDERTNSIIVVADEEMSLRVKALVEQLDSELDRSGGRFYVYRLQHADSEELAEILNNLINGSDGSSSTGEAGTQGSSLSSRRGNTTATTTQNASQARLTSALRRSRDLLRQRLGSKQNVDEGKVNLEGEVSIAPDPATNSLVINASRADYNKIKDVISLLDVKRRQVIVEATILEITLSNSEGMGVELQGTAAFKDGGGIAQTNYGGLTNLLTNPAALTDLTLAAASTGTVTLPGGITIPSQAVLVTAVSRLSNVNVLSAPTIMATDNQEAEIIVGQNVPFVTSTSTDSSNINNTFNTIERQDVGITLRITPQISSGNFVVLSIFVEISNVVAGTANDPNGPTTTIRTTETAVTVKDGQMVVTGGLIQDSITDSTRGVPFLQDVPVIGHLFKRQDSVTDKTNLLILITPKIIKDQFDARLATKDGLIPLESHIDEYDLYPKREEVFTKSSIDNVVERHPLNEKFQPTPVTPPLPRKVSSDGVVSIKPPSDEVLELSVAPMLPGVSMQNSKTEKRGSMSQPKNKAKNKNPNIETSESSSLIQSTPTTNSRNEKVAILRSLVNGTPKLVALKLPAQINHFNVGNVYTKNIENDKTSYVCIGLYDSLEQAKELHSSLSGNVEKLSPAQVVGLGVSSWTSSTGVQ